MREFLRPTFAALVAAEEELGPLFALVERAQRRASSSYRKWWRCSGIAGSKLRINLIANGFAAAVAAQGIAKYACAENHARVRSWQGNELHRHAGHARRSVRAGAGLATRRILARNPCGTG
jgi:hypothetical protein